MCRATIAVDVVRERFARAGVAHESRGAGMLVRDPSGNAALIAADPARGEGLSAAGIAAAAPAGGLAGDATVSA